MTKLIIQIPCFNEEDSLPITLGCLPREVEGVDEVEWLIIDDGSSDKTVEIAKEHGVDHVVSLGYNQGLASAFMAGVSACLAKGADIIVNTDADNQYNADDIPKLVQPVLEGTADMVVGTRPIATIKHFSLLKKFLQKFGSWVVRKLSGTDIDDAPSGFRAYSRRMAKQLHVYNRYTYTLETIIQAGQSNKRVLSVPIRVNDDLRPSRLVKNIFDYVRRSLWTIVRIYIVYRPLRFFSFMGTICFLPGFFLLARFFYFFFNGDGQGYIQSVVIGSGLLVIAFILFIAGILADLNSFNRRLLERMMEKVNDIEEHKPSNEIKLMERDSR